MQRIAMFLLGLLVGSALVAAVPSGQAHDDLTGGLTTLTVPMPDVSDRASVAA